MYLRISPATNPFLINPIGNRVLSAEENHQEDTASQSIMI